MSNHFHLVCFVPEPRLLSIDEVLERIEALYGPQFVPDAPGATVPLCRAGRWLEQFNRLLGPYRRRMNDFSIFLKELKGGFAQWYNRQHQRYGALWAERFKERFIGRRASLGDGSCLRRLKSSASRPV